MRKAWSTGGVQYPRTTNRKEEEKVDLHVVRVGFGAIC